MTKATQKKSHSRSSSVKCECPEQLPPAFRAMADQTRLRILLMLEGRSRTVGEIVDFFDLSQPTITRHLQTLATAGLVKRVKKGQKVTYALAQEHLTDICCQLVACFPCCCVTVTPAKVDTKLTTRKPATRVKVARRGTLTSIEKG